MKQKPIGPIVWRRDVEWKPTRFQSLASVKRWATRYKHVYMVRGKILIVSTADGTIHQYADKAVARSVK
jgi:hypothetical protein